MNSRITLAGRSVRSSGFSLVEILLVILILLMLAGATVMYVLPQQEGAQADTTRLKLTQVQGALDMYRTNMGHYPTEDEGGLNALVQRPALENEAATKKWRGPYLKAGANTLDAWDRPLKYEVVDKSLEQDKSGPDYRLFSLGPDGQEETDDDVSLVAKVDAGDAGVAGTTPGVTGNTGGNAGTQPPPINVNPNPTTP
ncbi:MAG: type II secretion system major pseudopilin GspG [Planctomycetota bacterium]